MGGAQESESGCLLCKTAAIHPQTASPSSLGPLKQHLMNLGLPLKSCPTAIRMMFQRCELGSVPLPHKVLSGTPVSSGSGQAPLLLLRHPSRESHGHLSINVTQTSSRRVTWTLVYTSIAHTWTSLRFSILV